LNGVCELEIGENCKNSDDCKCGDNELCRADIRTKDKGCIPIDSALEIDMSVPLASISASTLYSNPSLKDESGNSHSLINLAITNNGNNEAKNIGIALKLGSYSDWENKQITSLKPRESKQIQWNPIVNEKILEVKNSKKTSIQAKIQFEDEQNKQHDIEKTFSFEVKGRNQVDPYTSYSQFITPTDDLVRYIASSSGEISTNTPEGIQNAAEAVWNTLSSMDLGYISDPNFEYVQYPSETLKNKKGDCEDLSVLYVSVLESIGIKTSLLHIPGHMFSAYYDGTEGIISPVETTMLGSRFSDARNEGNNKFSEHKEKGDLETIEIQSEWGKRDIKPAGKIDVGDVPLPVINIEIDKEGTCKCSEPGFFGCYSYELEIECGYRFSNSGDSEGTKCITAQIFINDELYKTEDICETVGAKRSRYRDVELTRSMGSDCMSGTYRCTYR